MAEDCKIVKSTKGKAKIWQLFGLKESDGVVRKNIAVCYKCNMEVKSSGGTTNMITHVRRHHPAQLASISSQDSKSPALPSIEERNEEPVHVIVPSTSMELKQVTLPALVGTKMKSTSQRAMIITDKVARFLVTDLRPFRTVDTKAFQDMVYSLDPRYQIPSRKKFSEVIIPDMYHRKREDVKKELLNAKKVAVTTDGWTSRSTDSYVTVTSSHIDNQWQLKNFVLQTRLLPESHTGENLASALNDCFDEWGIEHGSPMVSDNAANMVKAGDICGCLPHVKCYAHTLNLAVQKVLKIKQVSRINAKVRSIVSFFHRSTVANALLKVNSNLLHLPNHKLVIDVSTRWNSVFDMLERYLEMDCAVLAVLRSKEIKVRDNLDCISENERVVIETIKNFLAPIKSLSTLLCTEQMPSASMIMPLHKQLVNTTLALSESDTALVSEMKNVMLKDLAPRYNNIEDFLIELSAIDPRFKQLLFVSEIERENCFLRISEKCISTSGLETINTSEVSQPFKSEAPKINNDCISSLFGDIFDKKVVEVVSKETLVKKEIITYKEMPGISYGQDPLQWWRDNENTLPILSSYAKINLMIPATSVPSERVFSTAGDIITAQRSNLKPENVDMLIFLKKNMES